MKYRWGIVGIGDIAGRGMAPALNRAADTALVSVFSRRNADGQDCHRHARVEQTRQGVPH